MPRHDHGQQSRKESGQRLVRLDQNLFLAGMGRGCDDRRPAARHCHQLFELAVVGRRRRHIQFQIACRQHVAAAERDKPLGIGI
jgi:hypothetical protein